MPGIPLEGTLKEVNEEIIVRIPEGGISSGNLWKNLSINCLRNFLKQFWRNSEDILQRISNNPGRYSWINPGEIIGRIPWGIFEEIPWRILGGSAKKSLEEFLKRFFILEYIFEKKIPF